MPTRSAPGTAARWGLAAAVLAFFLLASFFAASWIGWSVRPPGWHRVTGHSRPLLLAFSVVLGLTGVLTARAIVHRPLLSAWLLLALPLPALAVLDQGLGVL